MDVSELRKRILRSLDDARKDASERRVVVDAATKAYDRFIADVAVPLMRQSSGVLKASGFAFDVQTPASAVRLVAEKAPHTFIEFELDATRSKPEVIGRVSLERGRHGGVVEERPIAPGKAVADLTEDDLSTFLIAEIPKLVVKS